MEEIKYISVKNNVVSIATTKLPFKITPQKCESYLDIHLKDLKDLKDDKSSRCCYIFNKLLRYADGYERDDDKIVLWREFNYWNPNIESRKGIFSLIFQGNLSVVCVNPNTKNAIDKEFKLEDFKNGKLLKKGGWI